MFEKIVLAAAAAMLAVSGIHDVAVPLEQNDGYYIIVNRVEQEQNPNQDSGSIGRPDAVWFGEIEFIFARGTDAVVRDIVTGRTFEVRRTFGTNHADIEPLTKRDAEIMYEIWGGHSWERRAVSVYVGGYVFAGSLTNFPHAGVDGKPPLAVVNNRSGGYGRGMNFDAIAGNGVCGHMCLHFAGSLSHGNAVSSAAHQRRVAEAADWVGGRYLRLVSRE